MEIYEYIDKYNTLVARYNAHLEERRMVGRPFIDHIIVSHWGFYKVIFVEDRLGTTDISHFYSFEALQTYLNTRIESMEGSMYDEHHQGIQFN